MAAYILAHVRVTDWDRYGAYVRHTPRVIAEFGGRFLVRGAEPVVLEGEADSRRVVIIEFPSLELAQAFFASPQYARVRTNYANVALPNQGGFALW